MLLSGENNPDGGKSCWGSGFLPTVAPGRRVPLEGEPVLFVSNPEGVDAEMRRPLDRRHQRAQPASAASTSATRRSQTRIAAYELAYRMQTSVPELTDLSKEPPAIHELYGTEPGKASFANNCLLARRLVERGVRFVQLYHRGWDTTAHRSATTSSRSCRTLPADRPAGRRAA